MDGFVAADGLGGGAGLGGGDRGVDDESDNPAIPSRVGEVGEVGCELP